MDDSMRAIALISVSFVGIAWGSKSPCHYREDGLGAVVCLSLLAPERHFSMSSQHHDQRSYVCGLTLDLVRLFIL